MSVPEDIRTARFDYARGTLDEASIARDPFEQFRAWLDDALAAGLIEPNGMTLATVDADGRPSARVVLLRGFDRRGFTFFTNYESRKGRELDAHPWATLAFWWGALERQVRIEGRAERVDAETSDAYFRLRPRGHQLGSWASRQSAVVPDRASLEEQMRIQEERFAGRDVDRPPYWGGYRITPSAFEFWQGRPDRLHDRILYRGGEPDWQFVRLSP